MQKRPLFIVCLVLVCLIRIALFYREDLLQNGSPDCVQDGESVILIGQICRKENDSFWIQSVSILNSDYSENNSIYISGKILCTLQNNVSTNSLTSTRQGLTADSYKTFYLTEQDLDASGLDTSFPLDKSNGASGLDTSFSLDKSNGASGLDTSQQVPEFRFPLGCWVMLRGTYRQLNSPTNPGEFDSLKYYRSLGVSAKLQKATIVRNDDSSWPLRELAYQVRCAWKQIIYQKYPPKEAGVLSALLLGDKSELDKDLKDLYKKSGILHILSISSLHITIIGMSLYNLLRKLKQSIPFSATAATLFLLFYAAITGFGISTIRAVGMFIVKMISLVIGRTYDLLTALGLVGFIMVVYNPYYLQNSGFLLSFSAVMGIGIVYPSLKQNKQIQPSILDTPRFIRSLERSDLFCRMEEKYPFFYHLILVVIDKITNKISSECREFKASLFDSMIANASIMMFTLPVLLSSYYEVPVWSIFLNLIILPLVKTLIIMGLLSNLPFMSFLSFIPIKILQFYELSCNIAEKLPFQRVLTGQRSGVRILIYYSLLLLGVYLQYRKNTSQGKSP